MASTKSLETRSTILLLASGHQGDVMGSLPVYGIDIEISHIPAVGAPIDTTHEVIHEVALSTDREEHVFTGDEVFVLRSVDSVLHDLPPGILATWNGSLFDLPFLADRAAIRRVTLGLRLIADNRLPAHPDVLCGHSSAYRASWYAHRHLDAARLFRTSAKGAGPADVPGNELHHEAVHAFATNDARLVRVMAQHRGPSIERHADRIQFGEPVALGPFHRVRRVPQSPAHPAVRARMAQRA